MMLVDAIVAAVVAVTWILSCLPNIVVFEFVSVVVLRLIIITLVDVVVFVAFVDNATSTFQFKF